MFTLKIGFHEQVFSYIKLLDIFLLCEDNFLQNAPLIKDFRMQRHFLQSLFQASICLQKKQNLMGSRRPPKMCIMPDKNCADNLCSALFALQTRIWISSVASQFSCLLEKSQDTLACIQNYFALMISLKTSEKPISRPF